MSCAVLGVASRLSNRRWEDPSTRQQQRPSRVFPSCIYLTHPWRSHRYTRVTGISPVLPRMYVLPYHTSYDTYDTQRSAFHDPRKQAAHYTAVQQSRSRPGKHTTVSVTSHPAAVKLQGGSVHVSPVASRQTAVALSLRVCRAQSDCKKGAPTSVTNRHTE